MPHKLHAILTVYMPQWLKLQWLSIQQNRKLLISIIKMLSAIVSALPIGTTKCQYNFQSVSPKEYRGFCNGRAATSTPGMRKHTSAVIIQWYFSFVAGMPTSSCAVPCNAGM